MAHRTRVHPSPPERRLDSESDALWTTTPNEQAGLMHGDIIANPVITFT